MELETASGRFLLTSCIEGKLENIDVTELENSGVDIDGGGDDGGTGTGGGGGGGGGRLFPA